MALSALALCTRALLKIGAQPIASLDEGTAEAEVAANLYAGTRDALLSRIPGASPPARPACRGWRPRPARTSRMPSSCRPNFLRALSAGVPNSGRGLTYRLLEDRLHCGRRAGGAELHLPSR